MLTLEDCLSDVPVIAILRGVEPADVVNIASCLIKSGIRVIEVPLNSEEALNSISRLTKELEGEGIFGAGTVLNVPEVRQVKHAGGTLAVSPNFDKDVVEAALKQGLVPMPGIATATEIFAAVKAGATHLKMFPAATYGPDHIAALRAVVPSEIKIFAVGGFSAETAEEWLTKGASGFGVGSYLFRPGMRLSEIESSAKRVVQAVSR